MSTNKLNMKYCVLLPIVLILTIILMAVPTSFFGIEGLTVLQQRTIALFVFAALMWIFEIIPSWTTSHPFQQGTWLPHGGCQRQRT